MMTKQKVLTILRKYQNQTYVSGEAISRELGVSRAAVNTAVNSLREMGYTVDSVTRRGYMLTYVPDRITREELSAYLPPSRLDHVICLESVDSTNTHLKHMVVEGCAEGTVVIAEQQTNGRGRLGRSFQSPSRRGIYLSVYLRPRFDPRNAAALTSWTAVAVRRAIHTACGIDTDIKWVNDLILKRKKICGILTEVMFEGESGGMGAVIIGIGINVNQEESEFDEEIRQKASSLRQLTGRTYNRAALAAQLIIELDRMSQSATIGCPGYIEEYRAHNITVGNVVTVSTPNGDRVGFAEAVNDDFSLRVRFSDGTVRDLAYGEAAVKSLY